MHIWVSRDVIEEYRVISMTMTMTMSMHDEGEITKETQQINPSILIIIIILAVIFFLSCCLHILIRFHVRIPSRPRGGSSDPAVAGLVTLTALQGQLHHLFHVQHQQQETGLPQAFIDTLPLFLYKSVMAGGGGAEKENAVDSADCVVCLSEFEAPDRLRLLPRCSHAFHVDCIDTWLLCHSTCPLCRCHVLNHDESSEDGFIVDSSNSLETAQASDSTTSQPGNIPAGLALQSHAGTSSGSSSGRMVPVQLGKFKFPNTIGGEGSSSSSSSKNGRSRSYSLGSYEYVVDASDLRHVYIVPTPLSAQRRRFLAQSTRGCHRSSLSDSTPERDTCLHQPVFDRLFPPMGSTSLCADVRVKTPAVPGRGSVSFHVETLKEEGEGAVVSGSNRRSYSETQLPELAEHHPTGLEFEPRSLSGRVPSFARRTIGWLVGRQKRIVHASSSSIISTTSTTTASLNPQLESSCKQDIETGV